MKKQLTDLPITLAISIILALEGNYEFRKFHQTPQITTTDLFMFIIEATIVATIGVIMTVIINKKYTSAKDSSLGKWTLLICNILIIFFGVSFWVMQYNQ